MSKKNESRYSRNEKHYPDFYLPDRLWAILLVTCTSVLILTSCTENRGGPTATSSYASWSTQLSLAQQEAMKVDKDAVLMWVNARFVNCDINNGEAERISFVFLRPSGARIRIDIRDADPPIVAEVDLHFDEPTQPVTIPGEELARYERVLASVQVGPREACQNTLTEGKAYAMSPSVSMFLDRDQMSRFGMPTVWSVWYDDRVKDEGLNLVVSPQTGEILQRSKETSSGERILVTPSTSP